MFFYLHKLMDCVSVKSWCVVEYSEPLDLFFQGIQGPSGPPGDKGIPGEPVGFT